LSELAVCWLSFLAKIIIGLSKTIPESQMYVTYTSI